MHNCHPEIKLQALSLLDEGLKKEYSLLVEEFGVPKEEEKVKAPLEEEERVEEVVEEERKEEELPREEKVAEEAAPEVRTEEAPEVLKETPLEFGENEFPIQKPHALSRILAPASRRSVK